MRYRKPRLQDLVREEIASILQQEITDPGIGFITLIDVRLSDDLKHAKVYYSVYGDEEQKQKTGEALKRARGYIRHILGERIKFKFVPDLTFIFDTDQERVMRIEGLIRKVSDVPEG